MAQKQPPEFTDIMAEFSRLTQHENDWQLAAKPLERRDCRVYRAYSPKQAKQIAVKVFDPTRKGQRWADNMFKAMVDYSARVTPGRHESVPKVYALIEKHHGIVMEWVDAPKLTQLLKRRGWSKIKRREYITRAGEWLKWFHSHSEPVMQPYVSEIALAKVDKVLAKIRKVSPTIMDSEVELSGHIKSLKAAAVLVDGQQVLTAKLHGDFTPSNIFLEKGRSTGFDFAAQERGAVTSDICRFLAYLGVYSYLPPKALDVAHYGCDASDYEAFMSAYGAISEEGAGRVFLFAQYAELVRRWCSLVLQTARGKQTLLRQIELYRLRKMVEQVSNGLTKS